MENNSTITGKRGELLVMGKLMQMGLSVYIPVADVEGIDCIIRNDKKRLIEIQIKSRTNKDLNEKKYFRVKEFTPNYDFFIICYLIDSNETWVIPSFLFHDLSRLEDNYRILVMDLNVQRRLAEYKDNLGLGLLKLDKIEKKWKT